jgi:hypothetical protein
MHTHCNNVLISFYYFSVLYVNIFAIHLNLVINMYFTFTLSLLTLTKKGEIHVLEDLFCCIVGKQVPTINLVFILHNICV